MKFYHSFVAFLILVLQVQAGKLKHESTLDCDPNIGGCESNTHTDSNAEAPQPIPAPVELKQETGRSEFDIVTSKRTRSTPARRRENRQRERHNAPTMSVARPQGTAVSETRALTAEIERLETARGGLPLPRSAKGKKSKRNRRRKKQRRGERVFRPTNASYEAEDAVSTSGPYCPECSHIDCRADLNNCKGGLTFGFCNCCKQCAKVAGEECGGVHDHFGKCDRGLECSVSLRKASDVRVLTTRNTPEDMKGICTRADPPEEEQCKPECTREFCTKKRRHAICSARSKTIQHQSCQGDCQHTTCSACFHQKAPDCKDRCDFNDFNCIKKFGKCAKRKIYSKRKKLRGKFKPKPGESHPRFVCWVPQCRVEG